MILYKPSPRTVRAARLLFWPFLVTLVAMAASLITPLAVRLLIDAIVTKHIPLQANVSVWDLTWILLGVLLASNLLDSGLAFARGILVDNHATRYVRAQGARAIEAALYQPFSQIVGTAGRETAQSIGEILYIRDCLSETLSVVVRTLLALVLYSAVLVWLNVVLSLTIILILFPLQAGIFALFSRRAAGTAYGAVRKSAELGASLNAAMLAAETIRSYGFTARQITGLRAVMTDVLNGVLRARHAATVHQALSQFLSRSSEAILLIAGARAVLWGTMTLGDLVMFRMILTRIVEPLSRLGTNLDRLQRARLQLAQWRALSGTRAPLGTIHTPGDVHLQASVVFDRVGVAYENSAHPALDQIDLRIGPREIVFLLGPSGSGKSTMVRLLAGLLAPDRGTLHIGGHMPHEVSDTIRASFVACAFQEPILVPGTIEDNIRCFDPAIPLSRVVHAAEIAGASRFLAKLPNGLQTWVDTGGDALSGGERQRVCVARMIAARPTLMVIDEATSGLERALEVSVLQRLIDAMQPDQSLLVVTHREDLATLGTRIVRLDEGRVIQDRRLRLPSPDVREAEQTI